MSTLPKQKFFDITSSFYDEMISFDKALIRRIQALDRFITPDMKEAADLGCGTGLDSISLAKKNLTVTAFDLSKEMLLKAEENARNHGVNLKFVQSSLSRIPKEYRNKFSLAISLGNTLSNLNKKELGSAITNMFMILKKNGTALIQIVNAAKLMKEKERILNITVRDGNYYIRFYDYFKTHLQFNILKFSGNNTSDHSLITTKLYPYPAEEMKLLFRTTGFKKIKLYGNLDKSKFSPLSSKDIIILAEK